MLEPLRAAGIEVFEIGVFEPDQVPAAALRRAMEAAGLQASVCAILPAGINPISPVAAERRRAQQHLQRVIAVAAEMGASIVGGPVYAPIGYLPGHRPTPEEWQWMAELLHATTASLDAYGVTLCLEPVNRAETHIVRTAADARRLCESVPHPRIGVTLDTFHANIEEKSLPGAIRLLGPLLRHVHVSENDRGIPGTGQVDLPVMIAALRETGYAGCLLLEGFGYLAEEREAPGWLWAEQDVTPERVALEGAACLRRLLQQPGHTAR
ncbi:MAG: sugar phosphate isomerase/epimerase [Acidobacteriota bacterium]|nr:sugar phosphate isomerase/epimerase [Acidobacteriota bacterium]